MNRRRFLTAAFGLGTLGWVAANKSPIGQSVQSRYLDSIVDTQALSLADQKAFDLKERIPLTLYFALSDNDYPHAAVEEAIGYLDAELGIEVDVKYILKDKIPSVMDKRSEVAMIPSSTGDYNNYARRQFNDARFVDAVLESLPILHQDEMTLREQKKKISDKVLFDTEGPNYNIMCAETFGSRIHVFENSDTYRYALIYHASVPDPNPDVNRIEREFAGRMYGRESLISENTRDKYQTLLAGWILHEVGHTCGLWHVKQFGNDDVEYLNPDGSLNIMNNLRPSGIERGIGFTEDQIFRMRSFYLGGRQFVEFSEAHFYLPTFIDRVCVKMGYE